MAWVYSRKTRRYRNTDTGQFLSNAQMVDLRNTFMDRMKERAARVPTENRADWERGMREVVKSAYVDLAVLGRGGRSQMEPRDWGRVGQAVRGQYQFLGKFADALPDLSEAQTAARAGLYVSSAAVMFERSRAAAAGSPELPEFPGDGSQQCLVNCRCWWEIEPTEEGWRCVWHAHDDGGTCPDCARNAREWDPLVLLREKAAALAGRNGA